MPKVFIELDYDVVEKAIKAKVPAAVEDVLRRYDLQRLVECAITSDKKPEPRRDHWTMLGMSSEPQSPREQFEASLHSAMKDAMQAYIGHWLRDRPEIFAAAVEKALPKALAKLTLKVMDDDDD
jgi:hypothetical protein